MKAVGSREEAVLTYNKEIIRRVAADKSACCFKVQIAYYEAMGIAGMKVYAQTLKAVQDAGLTAISDIKRGDIAATAGAYAHTLSFRDLTYTKAQTHPFRLFPEKRIP